MIEPLPRFSRISSEHFAACRFECSITHLDLENWDFFVIVWSCMTNPQLSQYLDQYAGVSERLESFVHELAHTPEMVSHPLQRFEVFAQEVAACNPNQAVVEGLAIIPGMLVAKLGVARACIESRQFQALLNLP